MGATTARASESPVVPGFDAPLWPWIRLAGERSVYPANVILYAQGEPATGCVYYLRRGRVKVSILSPDGREKILAIHTDDGLFGETAAYDGNPHFATASTLCPSEIYRVPVRRLLETAATDPEVALHLLRSLGRKLRLMGHQLHNLAFLDSPGRVYNTLEAISEALATTGRVAAPVGSDEPVVIRLSHEQLASLAGTSRVTATRAIATLRRQGRLYTRRCTLLVRPRHLSGSTA